MHIITIPSWADLFLGGMILASIIGYYLVLASKSTGKRTNSVIGLFYVIFLTLSIVGAVRLLVG